MQSIYTDLMQAAGAAGLPLSILHGRESYAAGQVVSDLDTAAQRNPAQTELLSRARADGIQLIAVNLYDESCVATWWYSSARHAVGHLDVAFDSSGRNRLGINYKAIAFAARGAEFVTPLDSAVYQLLKRLHKSQLVKARALRSILLGPTAEARMASLLTRRSLRLATRFLSGRRVLVPASVPSFKRVSYRVLNPAGTLVGPVDWDQPFEALLRASASDLPYRSISHPTPIRWLSHMRPGITESFSLPPSRDVLAHMSNDAEASWEALSRWH